MSEIKKSKVREILRAIGTKSALDALIGKVPFMSVKGNPDLVEKLFREVLTDDNGIYRGEPGYQGV